MDDSDPSNELIRVPGCRCRRRPASSSPTRTTAGQCGRRSGDRARRRAGPDGGRPAAGRRRPGSARPRWCCAGPIAPAIAAPGTRAGGAAVRLAGLGRLARAAPAAAAPARLAGLLADDELAELAQTIATLTGGLVTIEDSTSARVLAYSRSSDEVDELRRLSILGRSGPPEYLALLREWGVYDRLAHSEEVLEIAEHPPSGSAPPAGRRGVRRPPAARHDLGAAGPDRVRPACPAGAAGRGPAHRALPGRSSRGAARRAGAGHRLADLFAGPAGPGRRPAGPGRQPALRGRGRSCPAAGTRDPADRAPAAGRAGLDRHRARAGVPAGRRWPSSWTAGCTCCCRAWPHPPDAGPMLPEALAMLEQTVTAVRRHLDPAARAGLGRWRRRWPRAGDSAREPTRIVPCPAAEPVLSFSRARNRLIAEAASELLEQPGRSLDPRVAELVRAEPAERPKRLLRLPRYRLRRGAGRGGARGASDHRPAPAAPRARQPRPGPRRPGRRGSRHTCNCVAGLRSAA